MKLVTVAEMKAIEQEADAHGWSYEQMMERAGQGLAEIVQSFYGYEEEQVAMGLVGSGNNGGDTLIALEHLARAGWKTRAYLVRPRPEKNDPLVARLTKAGGEVAGAATDDGYAILDAWLKEASFLLDGVLGTGVRLPLKEGIAEILDHVKSFPELPDVVAVDCPSGVDLDSGEAAPETIPADITVCMAAVKTGLLNFPAYELAGAIEVVDISLPADLPSWTNIHSETVTEDMVRQWMPKRPANSHKGTFGTVNVVAGSINFTGAALLSASAAYRIGAGLVQISAPAPLHAALAGQIPEAIWVLLPYEGGVIAESAVDTICETLEKIDVLLMGPGFGLADTTAAFVRRMLERRTQGVRSRGIGFIPVTEQPCQEPGLPPMVVDADGLKLLARVPDWAGKLPELTVLTPHPGEMSILTGMSVGQIQADRVKIARKYAAQWGHVVVLKGAMTVIAAPDGSIRIIPIATSALAHAGTGDVLAGMITGLRAQRMGAFEAACAGAWIHAQCGVLAAEQMGHEASVLAGNLIEVLPEVLNWVW
jgi:ADP-dependent NAD(P)H-hydrate dehydratase / NAD(P)H-hydrate epimerase